MLIAGTLGAVILLVILRSSATLGIKKVLITIASVYAASIILFYLFSSPVELVTKVFAYFPNINNYFGFLESPAIQLFQIMGCRCLILDFIRKLLLAGMYIY
jgi:hypothetical protein